MHSPFDRSNPPQKQSAASSLRTFASPESHTQLSLPRVILQIYLQSNQCSSTVWLGYLDDPDSARIPSFNRSSQIISTLTNNYANIFVATLSPYDRYAPGWTMISIRVDAAINTGYNHQFINFTRAGEWYYARVNGVTAPTTAGRYFFKMFLYGGSDTYGVGPTLPGTSPISPRQPGELPDMWVPPQNWPVLLVKGEVDPSIITGTIRYGGYNSTLYGEPIGEAGRIWAKMETKLDPYTGSTIATCPAESSPGQSQVVGCTDAIGYWNNTAQGHYEVEGVAS